eukprot:7726450-Pyramimonas_sp.AAC.1
MMHVHTLKIRLNYTVKSLYSPCWATLELNIKTLLSRLITRKFDFPADSSRASSYVERRAPEEREKRARTLIPFQPSLGTTIGRRFGLNVGSGVRSSPASLSRSTTASAMAGDPASPG